MDNRKIPTAKELYDMQVDILKKADLGTIMQCLPPYYKDQVNMMSMAHVYSEGKVKRYTDDEIKQYLINSLVKLERIERNYDEVVKVLINERNKTNGKL